jgi:drug/metabolite transporter (DMT)-like permease
MPEPEPPGLAARAPTNWAAIGFLLVLVFAWGGNYTWVKMALDDIGPWSFNAARYLGAALFLGTIFVALGRGQVLVPVAGERLLLACIGVLQVAMITGLTTVAMVYTEASRVVLIVYSVPVWALLWSLVLLGEKLTRISLLGAVLGIFGLVLLTPADALRFETAAISGTALALLGTNAWAAGAVLYRLRKWRTPFWSQIFWQIAVSATVMVPVALFVEGIGAWRDTTTLRLILVYNVVVPTALGFWCWAQALSRVPAATASQVLVLSPIFGMVRSHLVLGEPLNEAIWAAAAAVTLGAWLVLRAGRPA